jgi:hypothetical protein
MIYYKHTGRDHSWIIICSAYAPDLDMIADAMFKKISITVLIHGNPIEHGDFHNVAVLLLFAVLVALLLQTVGIRLMDSFIFAGIGFGAHLFEDALVFNPGYCFFWPLSAQKFGIGMVEYSRDWYSIANTEVLVMGLIAVMLCAGIRTVYEGDGWVKRMVIPKYFLS